MTDAGSGDIFDVKKIRRLVELMNEHDLAEVDLRQADQRIRIRRGHDPIVVSGGVTTSVPTTGPAPAPSGGGGGAAPEPSNLQVIKSPMVGTYYSASKPESPAFVKIGSDVGPDTVVCIIEAMKVFNEIPAECTGKIVAVLVENGDPVEFGQPLFKVDAGK